MRVWLLCVCWWTLSLFAPLSAWAAELWLTTTPPQESAPSVVTVRIATAGVAANVVAGTLKLPPGITPTMIFTEPSVVSYWIVSPTTTPDGLLAFAGMTPGGFIATDEPVFSFYTSQFDMVAVATATLLAHDGVGTPLPVSIRATAITPPHATEPDTEPPQLTMFELVRIPELFNGEPALVFTSADVGSGNVQAAIRIGDEGDFVSITSPYQLPPAAADAPIVLRLTDAVGNTREYELPLTSTTQSTSRTHIHIFIVLLGVVGAVVLGAGWRLGRRSLVATR